MIEDDKINNSVRDSLIDKRDLDIMNNSLSDDPVNSVHS